MLRICPLKLANVEAIKVIFILHSFSDCADNAQVGEWLVLFKKFGGWRNWNQGHLMTTDWGMLIMQRKTKVSKKGNPLAIRRQSED